MAEPWTEVTAYEVCAVPRHIRDWYMWSIQVEWRSEGQWAVTRFRECLSDTGEWDYESVPSEREDEWKDSHRFDLDTALRLAREQAPLMKVNGWTVEAVIDLHDSGRS